MFSTFIASPVSNREKKKNKIFSSHRRTTFHQYIPLLDRIHCRLGTSRSALSIYLKLTCHILSVFVTILTSMTSEVASTILKHAWQYLRAKIHSVVNLSQEHGDTLNPYIIHIDRPGYRMLLHYRFRS